MKKKIGIIFLFLALLIFIFIIYNFVIISQNSSESEALKLAKKEAGKKVSVDKEYYNRLIVNQNSFLTIMKIMQKNVDKDGFSTEQMLGLVTSYATFEDSTNLEKNSKKILEERPIDVKYEYLNSLANQFFDMNLDKAELGEITEDGYVNISMPTSVSSGLYKFNELRYDKEKDVYTLFVDEIAPEITNYDEIKKSNVVKYESEVVAANYKVTFKRLDDRNILLGVYKVI